MLAKKNVYIDSAYQHLQVISQNKEKRMEYEAREKAIQDYNQSIFEAEQRKAIHIAKNLKSFGTPVDIIVKSTGLSTQQVNKVVIQANVRE